MPDQREITRAEARKRRVLARETRQRKTSQTYRRVQSTMNRVRSILDDKAFGKIAHSLGIQTLPQLAKKHRDTSTEENPTNIKEFLDEASLEFVIAWKFFFPLLDDPRAVMHLEERWPGFIVDLKDAFIALVVEGPFPHAMSGHQGRKHGSQYQAAARRRAPSRRASGGRT